MKKILPLFVLLIFLTPNQLFAQYNLPENKIWIFDARNGIDFNNGGPTTFSSGLCYLCLVNPLTNETIGSGASVCDTSGKLLFYTDGTTVWNKNDQHMVNGNSLVPGMQKALYTYGADGAVITAMPGSPGKYYIFSLTSGDFYNAVSPGELYYSVVDMQLNNGLGDVVPKKKWISIDTGLTTKLVAVPGDDCNIWLIVHANDTNMFKAYEVTWKGVNPNPVISYTGLYPASRPIYDPIYKRYYWDGGQITISPDRKKLAVGYSEPGMAELYDFDPATGKVSNGGMVDSNITGDCNGVAFSPDMSKLYTVHLNYPFVSSAPACEVNQFDLTAGSYQAIRFSRTRVALYVTNGELRLAGDDKIYFASNDCCPKRFYTIEFPNLLGTACQAATHAIYGPPRYVGTGVGMGNDFVKEIASSRPTPDSTSYIALDTCLSETDFEGLVLHAPQGDYIDYTWDDNTVDSVRMVNKMGNYSVTCIDRCQNVTKVIYRLKPLPSLVLGADTDVCAFPVTLKANVVGTTYQWSTGSPADSIQVSESGNYSLTVNKDGCIATDTIAVRYIDVRQDLGRDTIVCISEPIAISLSAQVPDAIASILWSTGSTAPNITISDTGAYWVAVSESQCVGRDTIYVGGEKCKCHFGLPTVFSPNGDGKNDRFHLIVEPDCPVASYTITVYNRWGQKVYTGNDLKSGWDGTYNGQPQDIDTYRYMVDFTLGTDNNHYFQYGDVTLVR